MKLGLVGLGKMGGNMRERLRRHGHTVVGYSRDPQKRDVASLQALADELEPGSRVVWLMIPAGAPTRDTVVELSHLLHSVDIVVDGGNSRFTDDAVNAKLLAEKGIGYLDAGVSGGVWGLQNGYAIMVGGSEEHVAAVQPIFDALTPEDGGFVHAGEVGAGHFAKMVHNGIEYGLMQAYAEGYELLEASSLVKDVPGVLDSWRQGTVVRSWLLDLLVKALEEDPGLG